MMRYALTAVVVAAMALCASAQEPAKAPAEPTSQASQSLQAAVVSVSGPAQKLAAGAAGGEWTDLKAGEVLDEMTVIRTGLRAQVVLKFADRGEVTINNATKIGIGELRQDGATFRAKIGLKYGTIHAKVEKSAGPNDVRITTPVATMAVRGSDADVSAMIDAPGVVESYSGVWQTTTSSGSQNVLPGQAANSTLTQWVQIALERRDPGMAATGQTGAEKLNIILNGGGRGLIGGTPTNFDTGALIIAPPPVERRSPPPPPPPGPSDLTP